MRDIPFRFDELKNVLIVIALIRTKMLLGVGSLLDNMHHQIINRPFVMFVGPCDMNCQGSATFIDQKMNFCTRFGTIRWIFTGLCSAQWRWNHFPVHRLPFPANFLLASVIIDHHFEQLIEHPFLLPGLKSLVQGAARHLEPFPFDCLPLASTPKNKPYAIDDIAVVDAGSPWPTSLLFGKKFLDFPPKLGRYLMEV